MGKWKFREVKQPAQDPRAGAVAEVGVTTTAPFQLNS